MNHLNLLYLTPSRLHCSGNLKNRISLKQVYLDNHNLLYNLIHLQILIHSHNLTLDNNSHKVNLQILSANLLNKHKMLIHLPNLAISKIKGNPFFNSRLIHFNLLLKLHSNGDPNLLNNKQIHLQIHPKIKLNQVYSANLIPILSQPLLLIQPAYLVDNPLLYYPRHLNFLRLIYSDHHKDNKNQKKTVFFH